MRKRSKNGFTIVELVIVIAVIGILTAILIPLFVNLTGKAQERDNQSFVRNINTQLAMNEADKGFKNPAMEDSIKLAQNMGFDVTKITPYNNNDIVWDSVHDRFAILKSDYAQDKNQNKEHVVYADASFDVKTPLYQLWKVYAEYPDPDKTNQTQTYSIYAKEAEAWDNKEIKNLHVGFDAGKNTKIKSVQYVGSGNTQDPVVIRTNSASTELVVNAPKDTVKHYDAVGQVHVIAVDPNNCYEENGKAAFTQVDSGKYKTASTADVELLFVSNAAKVKVELAAGTVDHAHAIDKAAADTINGTNPGVTFDYDGNDAQSGLDVYHHVNDEDKIGLKTNYSENKTNKAVTEVVNEALENTVFAGVAVSKTGEATQLMTLVEFAKAVNAGNSYAGYTIKLLDDIDLTGVTWTPIGTTEHPFSGVFDGQNYKITNLTYDGAPTGQMLGLFGEVKGTKNDSATTLPSVWSNDTFNETGVSEHQYTAVIKNVMLTDFNITNKSSGGSTRYTGALAGRMDDAYIANVTVSNSTIKGTKGVGGLVGSFNGSTAKNCRTLSGVKVEAIAGGYNIGGLFGGTNYAKNNTQTNYGTIIDCENNAAVTIPENGANGGYIGGIVGFSQSFVAGNSPSSSGFVFINCTNNGKIEAKTSIVSGVGGIAGFGQNAVAFVGCKNTGELKAVEVYSSKDDEKVGHSGIAGISFGGNQTINCTNSGKITANAVEMAGVYIDYAGQTGATGIAYGCTNTGILNNTRANGITMSVALAGGHVIFTNETFANVEALRTALEHNGIKSYEFINCNVADKSGVLNLAGISGSITSNNKLCDAIIITDSNVALNIPDAIITVSGNSKISISSMGAGCTVTVAENTTVKSVTVGGNNSSLTVNGNVPTITLAGDGNVSATISADASAGCINFGGTGTYTLTNRGKISHTQSEGNNSANEHTVSTIKACNITINNYGEIEAKKNGNNKCSYAMLFYGGCNVVVNQYHGSSITAEAENGAYLLACSSANSVVYQTYDENGTLTETVNKK